MQVILVRHGQTDHNLPDSSGHAGNDAPLNELGIKQAQTASKSVGALRPNIAYASPFLRCQQTAKYIAEYCAINVSVEPELKEFDMGDWANIPAEEAKKLLIKNDAWSFSSTKYMFRVPGGESWEDVHHRVQALLTQLHKEHANETIVLVSHNQTIRALIGVLTNKPFKDWFGFPIENGSVRTFDYSG